MKSIHIYWDGPYTLEQLSTLTDDSRDYGIYQVYGGHPVYGSSVLLYIGQAERRTFGVRVPEENWFTNRNAGDIRVYVGRLAGPRQPSNEEWKKEIALSEKLLIYSHTPACNIQFINILSDQELEDVHVLNWGSHCDLMAEVSGRRWTSKYQAEFHVEYKYGADDTTVTNDKNTPEHGKYAPLFNNLRARKDTTISLQLIEIETIIGSPLPASASKHRAWWSNDNTHPQAKAWLMAGWRVSEVMLPIVTFKKIEGS